MSAVPELPISPVGFAPATRKRGRVAFAALVTMWSIALAEVSIANEVFGILNPVGLLLLAPVYGGQALLLASWVFRANRRPTLAALWSAGFVMGLYEFYITAVLWGSADWDTTTSDGGIAVFSLVVLAFFWHPFMAFIFPLMIAENLTVARPHIAGLFPEWFRTRGRKWQIAAFLILCAFPIGIGQKWEFWVLWIALPATVALLWFASRALPARPKATSLVNLLPSRSGIVWLMVVVGAVFALMGTLMVTTHAITLGQQAAAWGLYAFAVLLLASNLRHTAVPPVVVFPHGTVTVRRAVAYVGIASFIALAAALLPTVGTVALVVTVVVIWGAGSVVGVTMLARAMRGAVRRRSPSGSQVAPSAR